MITCILLAAGLSERFGSPKALASITGKTVIEHVQNTLLESHCDKIIVVLGAHAQQIHPYIFIHSRIRVVYNKHYNFGQTSSVQTAWQFIDPSSEGLLQLPVDCPLIQPATINKMIDHFKNISPDILIPTYKNIKGHPPIFHRNLKSKILNLSLNDGLNSLFSDHPPQTLEIEDSGIIKSFNTPQEFDDIKKPC